MKPPQLPIRRERVAPLHAVEWRPGLRVSCGQHVCFRDSAGTPIVLRCLREGITGTAPPSNIEVMEAASGRTGFQNGSACFMRLIWGVPKK